MHFFFFLMRIELRGQTLSDIFGWEINIRMEEGIKLG